MSGPDLREHSYVKVLYDFQYKTTEGREIAIKKNERLYLLQKTNADWWQVVRTFEQTSFYVPATYVREMSKSGGNQKKTSDEDKDVAFESLDGPKYKNMPKETSSAMKNVKKWLAGAIDSKQESPASSTTASSSSLSKSLYITDESHKHNAMDYQSRAELKVGLAAIKAKSLERDRERRSTYERQKSEQPVEITKFKKRPNETPKKLPNTMGIKDIDLDLLSSSPSSSYKLTKSFSTSPKSFDAPAARIEIPLPDPFRQELKSSLDRRRKISDNADYDKLVQENRNHELNRQSRIRTKSSHSDDSQLESDNDERFLSRVDENPKRLDKPESKLSVSLREDSGTQSGRQSPSVSNRNSRSLDLDSKQFSLRTERSLSPKPNYGRQLTVAGQIADEKADANNASSDCKILNDKRRTWAVEELMSELTQMCRERVNNKKPPNFQLKSTEIKGNFDPLDELTRELHEMNLQRSEGSTPQAETRSEFKSNDGSPSNVCKISINSTSGSRIHDLNSINTTVVIGRDDDELEDITEHSNISEASDLSDSSLAFRYPKVEKSTFTFRTGEVLPQSKPLKSPKSPKIDEYNEANILNDCSPDDKFDNRSLSLDKQSHYLKSATITTTATTTANDTSHSSPDNDQESSGYSNFKMRHTGKVKMRPKAKVKSDAGGETQGELKLTPSLEKLASEIQFLPAKKTTNVNHHTSNHNHNHSHSDSHSHSHSHNHNHNRNRNNDNSNNKIYKNTSSLNESMSDGDAYDDSGIHDETYRSEDSGSGRRNIIYSNSFKTKREGRYFHRHEFTDDDDDEDEDDDDNDDDDEDDDGIISAARKCNLKKSSTLHCATIPENYRRFRISNDFAAILARSKRRSRSLSDLNSFDDEEDVMENVTYPQNSPKIKPVPLPRTKIPAIKSEDELSTRLEDKGEEMGTVAPLPRKITTKKDYPEVWVNSKQVPGYRGQTPEVDIESSTAVGFKSLLCTSDSGSDNCLQSKELVNNDSNERHDSCNYSSNFKNRGLKKSSSGANLRKDGAKVRESPSDEQILSSNASSEALQSQSESEFTGGLDASSQPSPVSTRVAPECYECAIDLPPGWTQKYDPHTDQICFINEQGDKWFSSNDDEGKIYFFEENSNESSWVLPTVTASKSQNNAPAHKEEKPMEEDSNATNEFSQPENSLAGTPYTNQNLSNNDAMSVSGSKKPGLSDWPQLSFDGNMIILKEGSISRTKITENGKKLRKNWNTSYAVLTELFLLFFKDSKTFNTMMKSGQSPIAKPDISVDLNGAIIEPGERASSRKNVYMISTVLGLQVLIQSDNTALAAEWFQEIHGAIRKLPFSFKSQAKPFAGPPEVRKISNSKLSADQSEESKKSSKVARSRSMKTVKRLDDSLEDLSGTVAERQTKIKAKLRRFFQRRPPVESLVKNGIYKNEPAFGSYLKDVCPTEHPRVPLFVKTCIEVLESNEDNMKTDGLYRASGNLSQIQKIRLQVDQYNLSVLSQEEDVHVLTGALKLFFRELKEPLIPSSFFKEALNASMLKKTSTKIQCFRDIVKALPPANYDTLQFLLKHLLKVTSYQEFNRMHIPNLAIVFGPTLMWPAEESANMALDLMQQNLVIECLLSEYNKIFK